MAMPSLANVLFISCLVSNAFVGNGVVFKSEKQARLEALKTEYSTTPQERCKDAKEEYQTEFFKSLNGKVVQQWFQNHSDWNFQMLGREAGVCSMDGELITSQFFPLEQVKSSSGEVTVTLDYRDQSAQTICDEPDSNLDVTEHNIQTWVGVHSGMPPQEDIQFFYEVFTPDSCNPKGSKAPCPMVVSLHGLGLDHTPKEAMQCRENLENMGVVVLAPTVPQRAELTNFWDQAAWVGEKFIRDVTLQVLQNTSMSIDAKRVYLWGYSMGASRALEAGLTSPDIFSQVFLVSPSSALVPTEHTPERASSEWKRLWDERKSSSRLKRLVIFLGGEDKAVHSATVWFTPRSSDLLSRGFSAIRAFGRSVS